MTAITRIDGMPLDAATSDELTLARGELVLRLAEATGRHLSTAARDLEAVEAEIARRRQAMEREAAVEEARQLRARVAAEEANQAAAREIRETLRELAPKRATAARKVDKAVAVLVAACTEWKQVAREQQVAVNSPHTPTTMHFMSESVIGPKIGYELAKVFPHSDFRRWEFLGRDDSFAELDAGFAAPPPNPEEDPA